MVPLDRYVEQPSSEEDNVSKVELINSITSLQAVGTDDASTIQKKELWDSAWLLYEKLTRQGLIKSSTQDLKELVRLYQLSLGQ